MRLLASRKSGWSGALPLLLSVSASAFAAEGDSAREKEESGEGQGAEGSLSPGHAVSGRARGRERSDQDALPAQWYLMTYPTGTMPSMPWTKAKKHNDKKVQDAAVWEGEGLVPPSGSGADDGIRQIRTRRSSRRGTNTWVSYGPKPLDSVGTTNNAYRMASWPAASAPAAWRSIRPTRASPMPASPPAACGRPPTWAPPTVTWTPLWDDKDFVIQSAGAIEIDPNNSNVVYVGTGRLGRGRSVQRRDHEDGRRRRHLDASRPPTSSRPTRRPCRRAATAGPTRTSASSRSIRRIRTGSWSAPATTSTSRTTPASNWQICGFGANYTNPSVEQSDGHRASTGSAASIWTPAARAPSPTWRSAISPTTTTATTASTASPCRRAAARLPSRPCSAASRRAPATAQQPTAAASPAASSSRPAPARDGDLTLYAQVARADNYNGEGTYVLRPDGGSTTWTKLTGSTTYPTCACGSSGSTGRTGTTCSSRSIPATTRTSTSATSTPSGRRSIRPTPR